MKHETFTCSCCKAVKSIEELYKRKDGETRHTCKACVQAQYIARRAMINAAREEELKYFAFPKGW